MITPKESPSRAILERIADDYRRRGYEVLVEPRGQDLPSFLADSTPDMIARRANENVVIEVKSSPEYVDQAQVNAIAHRIAEEPGWQFVLMAPSPNRIAASGALTTLDEEAIRRLLDEAITLAQSGHATAALMLAWSATEGIVRLLVTRHGLPVDRDDPSTLIRSLASEGYLSDDDFHILNETYRLRSAVAHGRVAVVGSASADDAVNATQALARLSAGLLSELPASA